jgi:hypothetical protein
MISKATRLTLFREDGEIWPDTEKQGAGWFHPNVIRVEFRAAPLSGAADGVNLAEITGPGLARGELSVAYRRTGDMPPWAQALLGQAAVATKDWL